MEKIINNMYKKYNFLSEEQFESLIQELILQNKKNAKLEYILDSSLRKYVKKNFIFVIDNYIDEKLEIKSPIEALKNIIEISLKINYFPSKKEIKNLLYLNKKLRQILSYISENVNIQTLNKNMMSYVSVYIESFRESNSLINEKEYLIKIKNGDKKARQEFILKNKNLVMSISSKYIGLGLEIDDLYQEGMIGLITAIDRFDVNKDVKFSTYAFYWIKSQILIAINQQKNLKISRYMESKMYKFYLVSEELTRKLNREPSIEEISIASGISVSYINEMLQICKTVSLNECIDDEKTIEDELSTDEDNPEKICSIKSLNDEMEKLFYNCKLNEKQIMVLKLRYGLGTYEGVKSLEEIAKIMKLSIERIRQIEKRSLEIIRQSQYINDFLCYADKPDKALQYIKK